MKMFRIISRRRYESTMRIVIVLLVMLAAILALATAVEGLKPKLEVKKGFGTYDAKTKTYYPDFDDLTVQYLYRDKYPEGQKIGLKYSDIFKAHSKTLKKYEIRGEGDSNRLALNSKITQFSVVQKYKRTFSKREKKTTININWKNLMFVKDGDKEVAALSKSKLKEDTAFNNIKRACNFRYEALTRAQKEATGGGDRLF